jgi:hypothetical protein
MNDPVDCGVGHDNPAESALVAGQAGTTAVVRTLARCVDRSDEATCSRRA